MVFCNGFYNFPKVQSGKVYTAQQKNDNVSTGEKKNSSAANGVDAKKESPKDSTSVAKTRNISVNTGEKLQPTIIDGPTCETQSKSCIDELY